MEEIESILIGTLNTKRELRKLAEQKLDFLIKQSPSQTFLSLINLISSTSENLATLSSVLIYNNYITQGSIKLIDSSISQNAFDLFTSQLSKPISIKTRRKIGQILVGLSVMEGKEVDFLGYVANCCQNPLIEVTEFGFYLFEMACEYPSLLQIIQQQVQFLAGLIVEKLLNKELSQSIIICLYSILKEIDVNVGRSLEESFLKSLEMILVSPSLQLINSLFELTEKKPQIWNGKEKQLMYLAFTIANNTELYPEIRVNAVEILRFYLKQADLPVITENFWKDCVGLGFTLLAEPEYCLDIELWAGAEVDDFIISTFKVGFDLLQNLHKNPICQNLIEVMVNAHLEAGYWVHKNAGIIGNQLLKKPNVNFLLNISDPNPRLQWSVLDTLGYIVIEKNSNDFFEQILRYSLKTINEFYSSNAVTLKMKTKCLSVINFIFTRCSLISEELPQSIILLLPDIYNEIFKALADTGTLLAGLKALALLIEANGEYFYQISGKFTNGLSIILNSPASTYKEKEIRAACIKCWCSIVERVQEFTSFTDLFTQIWNIKQGMEADDKGLIEVWYIVLELHKRLKKRFSSYLQPVVNDLICRIKTDIDIHLSDNEAPVEGYQSMTFLIPGLGEKTVSMSTIALEIKKEASKVLNKLIENYPQTMEPYFQLLLQANSSLISFEYNMELKVSCLKGLSILPKIESSDNTLLTIFQILSERFPKIKSPKEILIFLNYNYEFLARFPSLLPIGLSNVTYYCGQLSKCLYSFLSSKSELNTGIVHNVSSIICVFISSFGERLKPIFFRDFQGTYSELLFNSQTNLEMLLSALNVYCDYIKYIGGLPVNNGISQLLEQFTKLCYSESPEIRQSAASAVVACIDKDTKAVQTQLNQVRSSLVYLIELPNAKDLFLEGAEAAIAGIVKIGILFQPELIGACLNWMPLRTDSDEAAEIHQLLINNHNLIPNNKHLWQALSSSPYLTDQSRHLLSTLINYQ